jgi:hypothetical protein
MKIPANAKRKLVAAKKKAGKFLSDKKNRKYILMAVGLVLLVLVYSKYGKRKTTTIPGTGGAGGKIDTGTIAPPPTYIPDFNFGDVVVTNIITPKLWYQGWEEHCDIRITGNSEDWRLKDYGTESLRDGCIWRYQINGHVFHQMTRLDNYIFESNDDVAIWVLPVYIDKQHMGLQLWGGEEWQDPNISPGFSKNTSLGQSYYYFNKAAL